MNKTCSEAQDQPLKMNLSERDCLKIWMSIKDAMEKLTLLSISEMTHHAFDDNYIYCLPTCNGDISVNL